MQTASSLNPDFLDVFGFDAGRTREYCDLFAEHGFLVVLPDYFRRPILTKNYIRRPYLGLVVPI